MKEPKVSIIMRSFNEAWALNDTFESLAQQDHKNWELIVIDSGSSDGSDEIIRAFQPSHFIQIQPSEYNPSKVMNQGMRLASTAFGIFLNADATPQGTNWLSPLVEALQSPQTAAVFSRQIPRPNCRAVFACDYERCFGPHRESAQWDHFFSMVSSGIRKEVWAQRGFREDLQYAEDDEYTRWCKAQGYRIEYCQKSIAMHSHNYTLEQVYKRSYGDARAYAQAGSIQRHQLSTIRTQWLGWTSDIRHDFRYCRQQNRLNEFPFAARVRWRQRKGKLDGFRSVEPIHSPNDQTSPA
jgi:rhamnosyltransferase